MQNSQIISITDLDTSTVYHFETVSNFTGNDSSTITTYPTSEGTPRADNIYNNPNTFNVSVQIGGSTRANDEWGIDASRVRSAEMILRTMKNEAHTLQIETNQRTYDNMYLTSINISSNTQNAYDFVASLGFSELFIATYTEVTVGPFTTSEIESNTNSTQQSGENQGRPAFWKRAVRFLLDPKYNYETQKSWIQSAWKWLKTNVF